MFSKIRRAKITVDTFFKVRNFKSYRNMEGLVDFSFLVCEGLIKPWQVRSEILKLLTILNQAKPKCILEIGTMGGGVPQYWKEVKSSYNYVEIVKDWNQIGNGLGVITV